MKRYKATINIDFHPSPSTSTCFRKCVICLLTALTFAHSHIGARGKSKSLDPRIQVHYVSNLRAQTKEQEERFFEAVLSGDISTIIQLLEQGINLNSKGENGNTALMLAVPMARPEVIKLLLERGADVNAQNRTGGTALLFATSVPMPTSGKAMEMNEIDLETVQLLLEKGAKVNTANNAGTTPLMRAAKNGNFEMVELLIGKGANAKINDRQGKSAIFYARENGHQRVVRFLSGLRNMTKRRN